jgi:hypothetical protein
MRHAKTDTMTESKPDIEISAMQPSDLDGSGNE